MVLKTVLTISKQIRIRISIKIYLTDHKNFTKILNAINVLLFN